MSNNTFDHLKKKAEMAPKFPKYLTDSSWQESESPIKRYQNILDKQEKVLIDWVHEPLIWINTSC